MFLAICKRFLTKISTMFANVSFGTSFEVDNYFHTREGVPPVESHLCSGNWLNFSIGVAFR